MGLSGNHADLAWVSCVDDPVRSRLYVFVSGRREPVGRDEAAAATGIGRALAIYHLDKLVEAGLLTAAYRRPANRSGPGAGRPAKVYSRSAAEFTVTIPLREYELAAGLLLQAVAADGDGRVPAALAVAARNLGVDLGRRHQGDCTRDASPPLTLESALSERGYEPWHDEAGTVRMRNCPFRQLAELQPQVICQMNLALIEGLVEGVGAGGLRPVLDPRAGHCCVSIPAAAPGHEMNGTP